MRLLGSLIHVSEMIGSDNYRNAETPQIKVTNDGRAIAIWAQDDETRRRIWANRFDGSLWVTTEVIDINEDSHSSDPQIAIADDGSAIAVWEQYDASRQNIWASQFDGNVWGTAYRISRNDLGYSYFPQVAIAADGSAIAVWHQSDGITVRVWANRFYNDVWGAAEAIDDNAIESVGAGYPHITMVKDGSAIAVWQQTVESRHSIWANRFDSNVWGTPERIDDNDADDADFFGVYPRIAFADDGSAIAVWKQSDGIHDNIWANRYDGNAWGAAELIENNDSGDAAFPQVVIDDEGNAIAVWHQNNGSGWDGWDIWSNRFE